MKVALTAAALLGFTVAAQAADLNIQVPLVTPVPTPAPPPGYSVDLLPRVMVQVPGYAPAYDPGYSVDQVQAVPVPGYSFYCLGGVRYYGAYPYGNPVGACLHGDRFLGGGLARPRGFDAGRGFDGGRGFGRPGGDRHDRR
jgi:hypothetical protein